MSSGRTQWSDRSAATLAILAAVLLVFGIWCLASGLKEFTFAPDRGSWWYLWQRSDATVWTRLTAWLPYLLHQCCFWGLIYHAQHNVRGYSSRIHRVNVFALLLNGGFAALHVLQTQLYYDGLAQDVPEVTSFGSVVIMLILVMIMENRRRGMIWGKPFPIQKQVVDFLRRYHGYYFSWAIIYTFWYHPMETTPGHLAGIFYTLLLMIQGSLFFTRLHVHRWWRVAMETGVVLHAVAVAYYQPVALSSMFLFGFTLVFVLNQMHGLSLSVRTRYFILAGYLVTLFAVYGLFRGFGNIHEVVRIALLDYLGVVLLAGLVWSGLWVRRLFRGAQQVMEVLSQPPEERASGISIHPGPAE